MQPDELTCFVNFHAADLSRRGRRRLTELLLDGDDVREQVDTLKQFVSRLEAALEHESPIRMGNDPRQLWLAGMRGPGRAPIPVATLRPEHRAMA